jgi:NADPH-dependent 2,4-dienoyl-CoA reductase/sulfur reductase-like enzyme/glycerol uptake facilitator-like aquaporin
VVGSGIAAQRLSPNDVGLQLFYNSTATVFGLAVLILMLGPVSGAHFNPVVSLADWFLGRRAKAGLARPEVGAYSAAQCVGGIAGAVLANVMFDAGQHMSDKHRVTGGHLVGELVATAGLIALIFALARTKRGLVAAPAVGAYIGAAYWFTSSTAFANPAVTVGRMFTDTFAGITPSSAPAFIGAQVLGGAIGVAIVLALYPHTITDANTHRPEREGHPLMHLVAIGGSDAGISGALRARELDPTSQVTVVVADAYPFSICGIPYYISGEVTHWRNLAHRAIADLEATGLRLRLDTTATAIDVPGQRIAVRDQRGASSWLDYDELVVGTGAVPVRPPIAALDHLGPDDGVHLLHSMGDTFALTHTLDQARPRTALIVGAGYVGLEMAEGLTARGLSVTQVETLPEVLPTIDLELGALVRAELARHGGKVHTRSTVTAIAQTPAGPARLHVEGTGPDNKALGWDVDLVLVVVGVRPDTDLLVDAGAKTGPRGAVLVDETMATGLPHVWAAGDCVATHHQLLGLTYLPLGTTAHKQGRIAGENALGGAARFAGSLGTQVVKVFDLVAARTGLREHEATAAGYTPATTQSSPDDHKAYYPGASPITIRITGDQTTGRMLGAQLIGARGTETAKRVDTYATALHHRMSLDQLSDLDLSYTPPLGAPWDAVQAAAQAWVREHQLSRHQAALRRGELAS